MKALRFFISPAMMGVLFIALAASMAAATFIENDFGQEASRAAVYNTWWFELLFLMLTLNCLARSSYSGCGAGKN